MQNLAPLILLRLAIKELHYLATSVAFVLPKFLTKEGHMAGFSFASNVDAHVPLEFKDASEGVVPAVPGGSVTVADPAVATASMFDDGTVALVSVAPGSTTVTYTNGALTATLDFDVTDAGGGVDHSAVSVAFNVSNATFVPKEAPPAQAGA